MKSKQSEIPLSHLQLTKKTESAATRSKMFIILSLSALLILTNFYVSLASQPPSKSRISKSVNRLDFLTNKEKQNLTLSIYTGAKDALLDFSGAIGTENMLEVISSKQGLQGDKKRLLNSYQKALKENLPVPLVTKTTIRMLRSGAPFSTVLARIDGQINLLRKISLYLNNSSLYLTYQHKAELIDTLAESIVTYSRQHQTSSNATTSPNATDQLKQTLHNMVKFSSLPVSMGGNAGAKGAADSNNGNTQLSNFLNSEGTISDLARLAEDYGSTQ